MPKFGEFGILRKPLCADSLTNALIVTMVESLDILACCFLITKKKWLKYQNYKTNRMGINDKWLEWFIGGVVNILSKRFFPNTKLQHRSSLQNVYNSERAGMQWGEFSSFTIGDIFNILCDSIQTFQAIKLVANWINWNRLIGK